MAGCIVRSNFQDALQQRRSAATAGFVLEFGSALQCRDVLRRNSERAVVGGERFLIAAKSGKRDSFHRPEGRVSRRRFQGGVRQLRGLLELPGAKRGLNLCCGRRWWTGL